MRTTGFGSSHKTFPYCKKHLQCTSDKGTENATTYQLIHLNIAPNALLALRTYIKLP